MNYLVKKPWWVRKLYGRCTWQVATRERLLFLTFDDGPHPELTPFVLDELRRYDAQATFFCIGENVARYPQIYNRILTEGHAVGNHTWQHLDGWRTNNSCYYADVQKARGKIASRLFRPPHGHVTPFQVRRLRAKPLGLQVVMWSILSGDFDPDTTPERCYTNVAGHAEPGAIIVFHDNDAAASNLRSALPRILSDFSARGYRFAALSEQYLCR
ncbi:polysaccharide deacetylase family protein [Flaviaesturariibacter flavus]|uniref:Polysaccharide deacetylase family protein n=1 Tax=Flaviaesturariibacter flavus TaxID=2502780 RepID=A0A4R1BNV7_9BACT|nr:polysaccharide deacetylase family protein [Flaviaesturariibacter flavus]TCJ19320.1 polysaccharide deacetylase family protein [Flaviaesturariibacter flavus]